MQCFVVQSEEIEGRIDPFYYNPFFDEIKNLQSFVKCDIQEVSEIAKFVIDGIHKKPEYSSSGIPFIQVNNIKEGSIDFQNNIKCVSDEWESVVLKRYTPLAGDVLITKDGTIGIAATVPEEFNPFSIFVSVAAIRPNKDKIVPKFLEIIINSPIIQKQIYRATRGAVLAHLLLEVIRKLRIPLPTFQVQNQIVDIMQAAYSQKKQKEAEAQRLLDSIDSYVLDELGIKLPEVENKMCFVVSCDEVQSNRADAYYYQPRFEEVEKALGKGQYPVKLLKNGTNEIISGQRPKGGVKQIPDGVPSLGGEHILDNGCIATQNLKFIPHNFHESHLKSKANKNDILLVKDGATTGKIGIVPEGYPFDEMNINEHVFLVRCKKDMHPYYLFSFLNTTISQIQINRRITGGTIMGIVREAVGNLLIPHPPLEIQTKIAEEVKRRISEAERLKAEASRIIEEAKKRVEEMILGGQV
jgi:restriction endonuclease S subunit